MKVLRIERLFPSWFKSLLIVLFFLGLLAVIPLFAYLGIGDANLNSPEIEFYTLIWQVVVGASALLLFAYNMFKEKANYLHLNIEVIERNGYGIIRTEVSNQIADHKEVNSAFILITPVGKNIIETVNSKMSASFENTNSFIQLKARNSLIRSEFAFIPLPFYTCENVHVGNEHLSFEIPFKFNQLTTTIVDKQFYDVRFFVFRNTNDVNNLHRVVACSVELSTNLNHVFVQLPKSSPGNVKIKK